MKSKRAEQVFTIPNLISFFRIALIPFITWTYLEAKYFLCAVIIVISSISDVLDGIIARKFNMISALGKALDPVADKLTLLSILLCLTTKTSLLYFLLAIFIIKEVTIGIEGLIIIKLTGTTYSARWYGKLTTAVLYCCALLLVVVGNMPYYVTSLLFYVCVVVNLFSLVMYSIMNMNRIKILNRAKNEQGS